MANYKGETDNKLNKNQNKDSFPLTLPAISTTTKIHQKLMAVHVFLGYQKRQVSDLLAVTRAAQQERMDVGEGTRCRVEILCCA